MATPDAPEPVEPVVYDPSTYTVMAAPTRAQRRRAGQRHGDPMGPLAANASVWWSNYFRFSGRASRSEFWWAVLTYAALSALLYGALMWLLAPMFSELFAAAAAQQAAELAAAGGTALPPDPSLTPGLDPSLTPGLDPSGGLDPAALPKVPPAATFLLFVLGAAGLYTIIPSISVAVRRLHDVGLSGWWWLLSFVPFGAIGLLVLYCWPPGPKPNRFDR